MTVPLASWVSSTLPTVEPGKNPDGVPSPGIAGTTRGSVDGMASKSALDISIGYVTPGSRPRLNVTDRSVGSICERCPSQITYVAFLCVTRIACDGAIGAARPAVDSSPAIEVTNGGAPLPRVGAVSQTDHADTELGVTVRLSGTPGIPIIGPVGYLAISDGLDPGHWGCVADGQPRGRQVERRVQPPVDLRIDRAGVAVSDDRRLAHQAGGLHDMQQCHPADADQHEDHRKRHRRLLFTVIMFHPHREPGDRGLQPAVVKEMSRVLISVREIERHRQYPFGGRCASACCTNAARLAPSRRTP